MTDSVSRKSVDVVAVTAADIVASDVIDRSLSPVAVIISVQILFARCGFDVGCAFTSAITLFAKFPTTGA